MVSKHAVCACPTVQVLRWSTPPQDDSKANPTQPSKKQVTDLGYSHWPRQVTDLGYHPARCQL